MYVLSQHKAARTQDAFLEDVDQRGEMVILYVFNRWPIRLLVVAVSFSSSLSCSVSYVREIFSLKSS